MLFTCTSIGATFWHDVLLIYSALAPEDTWMEAAHVWGFFNSVWLRGVDFFFKAVPDDVAR